MEISQQFKMEKLAKDYRESRDNLKQYVVDQIQNICDNHQAYFEADTSGYGFIICFKFEGEEHHWVLADKDSLSKLKEMLKNETHKQDLCFLNKAINLRKDWDDFYNNLVDILEDVNINVNKYLADIGYIENDLI